MPQLRCNITASSNTNNKEAVLKISGSPVNEFSKETNISDLAISENTTTNKHKAYQKFWGEPLLNHVFFNNKHSTKEGILKILKSPLKRFTKEMNISDLAILEKPMANKHNYSFKGLHKILRKPTIKLFILQWEAFQLNIVIAWFTYFPDSKASPVNTAFLQDVSKPSDTYIFSTS